MRKGNGFRLMSLVLALMMFVSLVAACSSPAPVPTPVTTASSTPVTQPSQPVQPAVPVVPAVPAPSGIRDTTGMKVEYLDAVPMTRLITSKKNAVRASKPVKMPMITWGGDVATIFANGGRVTQTGSIWAQKKLSVELFREDNPLMMVERVISGETPYFRGTLDQVVAAAEALYDRGIEMVVVYQMTWSTGGDTIVVRSDRIKTPADMRGKTYGSQLDGPHMLYLATVLKDVGLTLNDVKIKWLREITIPPYDSKGIAVDPMTAMQRDPTLDAVVVISPDMVALTSGGAGSVGTGAESSVKSAKLLLSTKTGGQIIADVIAVRKDYLEANRQEVYDTVHGLLIGQEALVDLYNNRTVRQAEYQNLLKLSAELLRDNPQATADIEGLLMDCTFVGYRGNVQFFTGQGTLRTFDVLTKEAQDALLAYGLITKKVPLTQANWDYTVLAQGLRDTAGVTVTKPKFDPVKVERFAQTSSAKEGVLFEFPINFEPNQKGFPVDLYKTDFDKVLEFSAKYPGAILLVEGHVDPKKYQDLLKEKQDAQQRGESVTSVEIRISQTRQVTKNLSVQRATEVRDALIAYAKSKNLTLDTSLFTVVGAGIDRPKYPTPKTEMEWRANMRAEFQFIQAEAELESFTAGGR